MLGFFDELDSELASECLDTPYHIVIVEGAAIALQLPGRMTGDVDVVSEGMPPALRRVVERVAAPNGLRPDWINSAAKLKTVAIAPEPKPVFTGTNLVVEAAGPRYLLAMKLVADSGEFCRVCVTKQTRDRVRWRVIARSLLLVVFLDSLKLTAGTVSFGSVRCVVRAVLCAYDRCGYPILFRRCRRWGIHRRRYDSDRDDRDGLRCCRYRWLDRRRTGLCERSGGCN